jgi:hypothetical protein
MTIFTRVFAKGIAAPRMFPPAARHHFRQSRGSQYCRRHQPDNPTQAVAGQKHSASRTGDTKMNLTLRWTQEFERYASWAKQQPCAVLEKEIAYWRDLSSPLAKRKTQIASIALESRHQLRPVSMP